MKIAVSDIYGVQSDRDSKLRYYYEVSDSYDFSGNSATNVTSVDNYVLFNDVNRIDYNKFRDSCKVNLVPTFSALTSDEQKELVRHYIYPSNYTQGEIDAFFTADEQVLNWQIMAAFCRDSRENRWEALRRRISFELTVTDSLYFYNDTKAFKGDYIDANLPYLSCWLTNTAYAPLGIDYISNGFAQKSYYTTGRKDICVDILVNGNYILL